MAALAGAQKTPQVWAFVKFTPRAASRSMFGVTAPGFVSRQPIQSFISSTAKKRTLGGFSARAGLEMRRVQKTVLQ